MTDSLQRPYRILAVDDEEIVQSLVHDALEEDGHQVLTAGNGAEAVKILETVPIDLLITDIRMPHMSGIELVEHARRINPAIGIIFMTGYASLTSARDAIKHGALDYVMKPFELSEIRQAVHNAINKLSETAAAASHDQLSSLSDLSHVLFAAGDKKSLVTSSLKFAMMHLHCDMGSILYRDAAENEYAMFTICDGDVTERLIGNEPMSALEEDSRLLHSQEPALVCDLEDHPVYQQHAEAGLKPFLMPDWSETQEQMIVIPVMRASSFYGLISLAHDGDSARAIQADLKFLAITASQLAINLENLALLEETQQAYSRLKALQDETIELEKMATRGAMSAEIGHELNNFLGVVVGNVDLLKIHIGKQNYDRLGKYLDTVSGTLAQITSFTDNLMDMSSISSQVEVIRFDKLLAEVVEYLEPQRRFDGIEVNVPVNLEPTFLEADTTQIQQLLYNLFHNAADAISGRTERRIDVCLETNFDTNSFEIAIRDSGAGMSSESLSKAFQEKFTTKKTGHGFGLVVCKRIIDKHNGVLQIESTLDEGTCITITFPLAQSTAAEQSATPREQPIPIG